MHAADPELFDFKAPIRLKKSKAKTDFWLSLDTADLVEAIKARQV
jgi:hypothetical protein